jgi:uncharacterized protein with GYD domain
MIPVCSLITCEPGKYFKVVVELRKHEKVKRAFSVHGRWDVVAEIEVQDLNELGSLVLKLSNLVGVISSDTLIGLAEGK